VKSNLKLVVPTIENHSVATPTRENRRRPNKEIRSREHLLQAEVDQMLAAVKKNNRYGHRDATMILIAYRHGLRAAELVDLRWEQIDFEGASLHVRRVKKGTPSTHPLQGDELRVLRALKRETSSRDFVFVSERKTPFKTAGFAAMIKRAGELAHLQLPVHPHMLRHGCGYALANAGHDTRSLQAYLATGTSSIRSATQSWRPTASKISGEPERELSEGLARLQAGVRNRPVRSGVR
jgi:integrase